VTTQPDYKAANHDSILKRVGLVLVMVGVFDIALGFTR
jgi:hypothetical protein